MTNKQFQTIMDRLDEMSVLREYFNVSEACQYLGVSRDTLYQFKSEGLKFYEHGRRKFIKRSDIDQFMRRKEER